MSSAIARTSAAGRMPKAGDPSKFAKATASRCFEAAATSAIAALSAARCVAVDLLGVRVSKIGKISKFYKFLQIFGGLVLGSIKMKFCKKICV